MDLSSDALEFTIEGKVRSLDFSTSKYLVVGGDECYAWVLHIIIDEMTQTPQDVVVIHQLERIDRIYTVRFSPDKKFLAIGGFDGKVALAPMAKVWNKREQQSLMKNSIIELERPGLIYCLDWSPTGDYLAIAGSDKVCGIYDASNFDPIHETACRSASIQDIRWSNGSKYLAMGDKEVVIINGKPPFEIFTKISHTSKSSAMAKFRFRINSLCWSPDDKYIAIGASDGSCRILETVRWTSVYEHYGMKNINALAWGQQTNSFNSDIQRYLVLSDNECTVALLKADFDSKGPGHADDVFSVASSSYLTQSTTSSEWVLREDEFRDMDDVSENIIAGFKSKATITTIAFSKMGNSKRMSSYLAYAADDCSLTIMRTRDWKAVFVSIWKVVVNFIQCC